MATSFSFWGSQSFGGGPPSGDHLFAALGGAASAGDVLLLCTSGIDGDGDQQPVITDDGGDGGAAWTLAATILSGDASARWCWFQKVCVGGEANITAAWPGSSNKAMVGVWATSLTQPAPYVIDSGDLAWTGSTMHFVCANPPSTDAESYVAMAAFARDELTFADIDTPPGSTTGAGFSNTACGAVCHYNNNEGANTVADVLGYSLNPDESVGAAVLFWGFDSGDVELAGAGTFGLGGSGDLEATGGITDLAGVGTFGLGGAGELEVTGGDLHLSGAGTFGLGGAGRLIAPFPHPVPGPADRSDLLECGRYDAMVFTRGLGEIIGRLPFGELTWSRVLDGVSTAGLTVDGVANRSQLQRCCALMGEVEPFEHELAIYRNGYRVWSGPITALSFPPNQIQVSAFDLSGWLQIRTLHENLNAVGVDLATIWVNYVQDAMSVDNSPGLYATVLALSGILADRLTQITEHNVALDAIAELARTGLDWTTIDRVMQAGPVLTQPPPITDALQFPLLIDASFRVAPTVLLDGLQGANCWYVQGGAAGTAGAVIFGEYGPAFPSTPDHVAQPAAPDYAAIEDQYGRIEKMANESRVLDQPSIDKNAQSRYDLTKRPVAVISEGLLLPSAPIAMRKLVPGSLANVHLSSTCKPIGDLYRIKTVSVAAHGDGSEDVNVGFQPLGTGLVLGTGDA